MLYVAFIFNFVKVILGYILKLSDFGVPQSYQSTKKDTVQNRNVCSYNVTIWLKKTMK